MIDKEKILNALDDFKDDYGTSFSSYYMEETSIIEDALDMYYEKLNKLAEYEKLEEEGKMLKMPCKIGDTIYTVNNSLQQKPFEYEIELAGYSSHISEEGFKSGFYFAARQKNDTQIIHEFEDKDIDKTVFLSKKDAEKKLSEIKAAKLNNFETELSDSQIETLNNKNINISEPFSTNVTLDYGNEVVYCTGKIQSSYEAEKIQGKKKPERNQEIERD